MSQSYKFIGALAQPQYGLYNEAYSLANLLHPYFRGAILKKTGSFDSVLKNVISTYKSTKNLHVQARSETGFETAILNKADALVMEFEEGAISKQKSFIELEFDKFLSMPKVPECSEVDIFKCRELMQNIFSCWQLLHNQSTAYQLPVLPLTDF